MAGLLRQRRVEDIFAVARLAVLQAHGARFIGRRVDRARGLQPRDPIGLRFHRHEDAEARRACLAHTLDDRSVPLRVRVFGIRYGRANGREHGGGLRAFHRHRGHRLCDIFERDIVGDDVFVQVTEDALARLRFGIQQEPVFETEQVDIGLDVPLGVQEKGVASGARRKLLHMVGGHGVQQAGAVVPSGIYAPARGEVQPCCGGA